MSKIDSVVEGSVAEVSDRMCDNEEVIVLTDDGFFDRLIKWYEFEGRERVLKEIEEYRKKFQSEKSK